MPGLHYAGGHHREHRERLQRSDRIGHQQQSATVEAVDEDAGHRGEQQERNLLREGRYAQEKGRARQVIDQPAGGDHLQPAADLRHALTGEEPAEVAVTQGPQALRQPHLSPRSFFRTCSKSARRLRSCATTAAGARSTNAALASFAWAFVISLEMRAISFDMRSASRAGSTSLYSMMRASPTTAVGA